MIGRQRRQVFLLLTVLASLELAVSTTVQAVPSFARQTNLPCNACHTVFPELTPFGRMFKLGGYVMSKSAKDRHDRSAALCGCAAGRKQNGQPRQQRVRSRGRLSTVGEDQDVASVRYL
ncbi:MAG: hypothetical protein B7Z68_08320 [Acidobacteria bacterium 21-70-11]|nr:MAG: hypothetical protein B7Z68_08320 [Acidobacteria bacterium 21-70-11]